MWRYKPTSFGDIFVATIIALTYVQSCAAISLRDEMFLTDEEQLAFARFKAQAVPRITTEYMKKDLVLIKYFRFCDMNETKAMDLLKENLKWRLDWGFETLTEDEISEYLRSYPFTTLYDKSGRGVFFVAGKYWDMAKATSTQERIKKFNKFAYHIVEEAYKKGVSNVTNRTASGIVVLIDGKDAEPGKGFCVPCLKALEDLVIQIELKWPGGLQLAYVLNAHPLVVPALNILKRTLSEKQQKYAFVFDENDTIWMPELLKIIAAEKIPPELYIRSQQKSAGMLPFFPPSPPGPPTEQGGRGMAAAEGKKKKGNKTKKKKNGKDDDDDDGDYA